MKTYILLKWAQLSYFISSHYKLYDQSYVILSTLLIIAGGSFLLFKTVCPNIHKLLLIPYLTIVVLYIIMSVIGLFPLGLTVRSYNILVEHKAKKYQQYMDPIINALKNDQRNIIEFIDDITITKIGLNDDIIVYSDFEFRENKNYNVFSKLTRCKFYKQTSIKEYLIQLIEDDKLHVVEKLAFTCAS